MADYPPSPTSTTPFWYDQLHTDCNWPKAWQKSFKKKVMNHFLKCAFNIIVIDRQSQLEVASDYDLVVKVTGSNPRPCSNAQDRVRYYSRNASYEHYDLNNRG